MSTEAPATLTQPEVPSEALITEKLRELEGDESWLDYVRPALAEFVGCAIFIFIACGAGMTTVAYRVEGNRTIGIALVFGLTIFVLAFAIGHISGGHLNCAVTFAFVFLGKMKWQKGLFYFVAQFLGGLVGGGFLKAVAPEVWWKSCFAANFIHQDATVSHAFFIEFFLTFFLLFVVNAACDASKSNQVLVPYAIGLCITCCHMVAVPLTGTSLNPTRSFASAAMASGIPGCEQVWNSHWVFWIGPILGGGFASFLYEYVFFEGGSKFGDLVSAYRATTARIL